MNTSTKILIGAGLGLVALLIIRQMAKKAAEAPGAMVDYATSKLSPYSTSNVIYDNFVGGFGRAVSCDDSWSLGTQIYDWTH